MTLKYKRVMASHKKFSPLDIKECKLWLDFTDQTTLFTDAGSTPVSAEKDLVYQVNDKSGNFNALQTAEANRPLYYINYGYDKGFGGLSYNGQGFLTIDNSILSSSKSLGTWVIGIVAQSLSTGSILVTGNKVGSNAGDWQINIYTDDKVQYFYNNATSLYSDIDVLAPNDYKIVATQLTGSGAEIFVNNNSVGSNGTTGVFGGNGQDLRIGRQTNDTGSFIGLMTFVLYYDAILKPSQLKSIYDYYHTTYHQLSASNDGVSDTDVYASQGVVTDGTYYWTSAGSSGDNDTLYKWSRSGDTYSLVTSRDTTTDWPSGATQINSIHYKSGVLYVGCNNYDTVPRKGWILEYDPDTLALEDTHIVSDYHSEGGAFGPNGNFFVCYHETAYIDEYDVSDWSLIKTHTNVIDTTAEHQGLAWQGNYLLANLHESDIHCEIYELISGTLYPHLVIEAPTDECTQGIHFDPTDSTKLYWAERFHGGAPADDHRIIESTFSIS